MKKFLSLASILLSFLLCLSGCNKLNLLLTTENRKNTLFQVSTIDALLAEVYIVDFKIKELKKYGDFGIGTFNTLDGELIMLDGTVYQIKDDGSVIKVDDDIKTPMATVNFFSPDYEVKLKTDTIYNFDKLQESLRGMIKLRKKHNYFNAIKIKGKFKYLKLRSVPSQTRPYQTLEEIIKNQPIFELGNIKGTMVGYFNPDYVKGMNVPGFHFHFISDDRKAGGHVLAFNDLENSKISIDELYKFKMILPENQDFSGANLSKDRSAELDMVEKE